MRHLRPILSLGLLLVLAGCATPAAIDPSASAEGGAAMEVGDATAAAAANASEPRIDEGNYHFVFGTRPGLVFFNGDLPEMKVAPGERILARAEWTPTTPTAATLTLLVLQGDEVAQELSGTSPIEIDWAPALSAAHGFSLWMDVPTPGVVVQQDVALTLTVEPANP